MNEWPRDTYVLIPSYKSVNPLKPFLRELVDVVPKEFICVVDDASRDGTYEFCVESGIKCLRHEVNRGKGAALRTGFAYLTGEINTNINTDTAKIGTDGININNISPKSINTNYTNINTNTATVSANAKTANWILTMDADGQHSPADIPRFITEARKCPAMGLCVGARDMRLGAMPPARILSNRLTSLILSLLSGCRVADSQCGFRMYSRRLVTSISMEYDRFEMESEVILKAAAKRFPIRFVRVQTLYLKDGPSHISHIADTLRWVLAVLRVRRGCKNTKTEATGG